MLDLIGGGPSLQGQSCSLLIFPRQNALLVMTPPPETISPE
jgi:hypothetical protein